MGTIRETLQYMRNRSQESFPPYRTDFHHDGFPRKHLLSAVKITAPRRAIADIPTCHHAHQITLNAVLELLRDVLKSGVLNPMICF